MMKCVGRREIVVFLDYDGTLSEIVSNPTEAFMTGQMRAALEAVSNKFPTAILSGRSLRKIYEFVNLTNIYYSGNHGNTVISPRKGNKIDMYDTTGDRARRTFEADAGMVDKIVKSEVKKYPDFRVMLGHEVLEVRPNNDLNKGTALELIMGKMGFTSSNRAVPLFIGDDRTDEDGFRAIKRSGSRLAIVVSTVPKETEAIYSLRNPTEVMQFLWRLVEWKTMK
uniref:Trehalose-phosphatase n=1 Tax=Kalanchoe fedtschenkoi TaxID=63787 RepID=A0A7N0U270_KALFE